MAADYKIGVLLDVHAVKDSQNGFDNSGLANRTEWLDENNFSHWEHALGEWMGKFNMETGKYDQINASNLDFAYDTVKGLLDEWGFHPALIGIEPVNEPWWSSDFDVLKAFYRDVRKLMHEHHSHLKFVFHDGFRFDPTLWNDLFADDDIHNVVMDTH